MKIYIAGPITGLIYEDAVRAFSEAETYLFGLGYQPVNPMKENGLDDDGNEYSWEEYMKRDIPLLCGCEAIYLLYKWDTSRGAMWEHEIAERLKMKRFYQELSEAYPPPSVEAKQ